MGTASAGWNASAGAVVVAWPHRTTMGTPYQKVSCNGVIRVRAGRGDADSLPVSTGRLTFDDVPRSGLVEVCNPRNMSRFGRRPNLRWRGHAPLRHHTNTNAPALFTGVAGVFRPQHRCLSPPPRLSLAEREGVCRCDTVGVMEHHLTSLVVAEKPQRIKNMK